MNLSYKKIWDTEISELMLSTKKYVEGYDEILTSTLDEVVSKVNSKIVRDEEFLYLIDPLIEMFNETHYMEAMKSKLHDNFKHLIELKEELHKFYTITSSELNEYENSKSNETTKKVRERIPNINKEEAKRLYVASKNKRNRIV